MVVRTLTMHLFVLFTQPEDVQNPTLPTLERPVIPVMAYFVPEEDSEQRFSISSLKEGRFVYSRTVEEAFVGINFSEKKRDCEEWYVACPPIKILGPAPLRVRTFTKILDLEVLRSLRNTVALA